MGRIALITGCASSPRTAVTRNAGSIPLDVPAEIVVPWDNAMMERVPANPIAMDRPVVRMDVAGVVDAAHHPSFAQMASVRKKTTAEGALTDLHVRKGEGVKDHRRQTAPMSLLIKS